MKPKYFDGGDPVLVVELLEALLVVLLRRDRVLDGAGAALAAAAGDRAEHAEHGERRERDLDDEEVLGDHWDLVPGRVIHRSAIGINGERSDLDRDPARLPRAVR